MELKAFGVSIVNDEHIHVHVEYNGKEYTGILRLTKDQREYIRLKEKFKDGGES